MFSSLQPARVSLIALLLASFVLSDDAVHKSGSVQRAQGHAAARNHVVRVVTIRQDTSNDNTADSGGLGDLFPSQSTGGSDSSTTGADSTPTPSDSASQSESSTDPPSSSTTDDSTPTPSDTGASSTPSQTSDDTTSSKPTSGSSEPTKSSETTSSDATTTSQKHRSTITSKVTSVADVTSDGKTYQTTYVATSLIPTNTASPVDDTPEKSDGMTPQTRKTVIGVVVGVGGAIFLALVFIVFWKFWGRRRSARRAAAHEDDALMMTSPGEKSDAQSGSNPFQSTLESYHAPQRPVNASSNF